MKFTLRHIVLTLSLLITIIATVFAPEPVENRIVEAKPVQASKMTSDNIMQAVSESNDSYKLTEKRIWVADKNLNLFAVKHKPLPQPSVLKQPLPSLVPAPVVPPLPFTYVGKINDGGKLTVFVASPQQNFLLKGGEIINGTYQVNRVEATKVVFTYLPLKEEQVMVFGGRD